MDEIFLQSPHRRWSPLRQEWVLVSPHRTQRPWQGQTEPAPAPTALRHGPTCYLCPGNLRAGGRQTPVYQGTYIFVNDYSALEPNVVSASMDVGQAGLLQAQTDHGVCRAPRATAARANSWSAPSFWTRPSATSPPKAPPRPCGSRSRARAYRFRWASSTASFRKQPQTADATRFQHRQGKL